MTSSIIKKIWISTFVVGAAACGASYLQGQSEVEHNPSYVPPSPSPRVTSPVPAAATASPVSYSYMPTSSPNRPASSQLKSPPSVTRQTPSTAQSQSSSVPSLFSKGGKNPSVPAMGTTASRRNSSTPAPPVYSKVSTPGRGATNGGAVTVSHEVMEPELPPVDAALPSLNGRNSNAYAQPHLFPVDRNAPPSIIGSHLGLKPGETATERSLRLMSAIGDLERHVEDVTQQNANLNAVIAQRDEKLQSAVREIRSARKDLVTAKEELERLKREVEGLREKVRNAEKDNAAVLQTMAPLLQQLLESDDVSSLPTKSAE